MIRKIDPGQVERVFKVSRLLARDRPRHVLLMKGGGFFCTCLSLQNTGIVCRHYFLLIRQVPECPYHISLIPRRWFQEHYQGLKDSDLTIEPFRYCTVFDDESNDTGEVRPADNYMGFVRDILPRTSQPLLSREEATKQSRYSNMSGAVKSIVNIASDNREIYDFVENEFKRVLLEVRSKTVGSIPVENPQGPIATGRPSSKRTKSSTESPKKKKKKQAE